MLGADFIDFIHKWQAPNYVSIEDFPDKFNFLFTTMLLIMATVVITAKQYVFKPLSCYCSDPPVGASFADFAENYCWVQGTYAIGMDEALRKSRHAWRQLESRQIHYYQWVPFILGIQCIMFYLPRVSWLAMVTNRIGSDAQFLVTQAAAAGRQSRDGERERLVRHVAKSVLQLQHSHREYRVGRGARLRQRALGACGPCFPSKRLGTALLFCYLAVKLLYLANSVGQLYLMHRFLGHAANGSGTLAAALRRGVGWEATLAFPRVTVCRVATRALAGNHDATLQCALPVNMLNEKLYALLWFWTLAAAALTLLSLPVWLHRVALRSSRLRFVRRLLLLRDVDADADGIAAFCDGLLHHDGVFIFKMMQLNAGDVVTGDVVAELWRLWRQQAEKGDGQCSEC